MKKLFVDMDGVVADFVAGVCRLFGRDCPYANHPERRGSNYWGIEALLGIDKEMFWSVLDEKFWANLPQTQEADDIMDLAVEFFGHENISFLTSPCRTRGCYEGKLRWAEKHFSGVPVIFSSSVRNPITGLLTLSPKHMLASPDSMLIDDHVPNVQNFSLNGGEVFLFPRYWNSAWALCSMWEKDLMYTMGNFTGGYKHV